MSYTPPPPELPAGSTVWAYLRDSGGPTQDRSTSQQRDVLEAYCQRHALNLALVFEDIHKTGTSDDRAQFYEMIDMTIHEPARPDGILLWSFARFARNTLDSQYHKATLRKRGIIIHSLIDDLPGGKYQIAFEAILDIANQEKAEQASRESKRGLASIVSKDGAMPGTPPRGFKREPITTISAEGVARTLHRWVHDPQWTSRVQQAFQMRAAGSSLAEINAETHLFGSLNSYRTFWDNKLYIGILQFGELTIPGYCAPLIDQETWDAVQLISQKFTVHMHMRSERDHPRRIASPFLLSGFTHCWRCDAPLSGHTAVQRNGSAIKSYRCSRAMRRRDCELPRIPAEAVEEAVMAALKAEFASPELFTVIYHSAQAEREVFASKQEAERKDIENRIEGLNRKIDNITDAIGENGHTKPLLDRLNRLEIERSDLQIKLSTIRKNAIALLEQLTDEQLAISAHKMGEIIASQDEQTIRSFLRGLIQKIVVDRTENRIFGVITIGVDDETPSSGYNKKTHPRPPGPKLGSTPSTVSKPRSSMGAPRFTHSISFSVEIDKKALL